jgi:hypothetical protein
MNKISFFKKIQLFLSYRKIVNQNKVDLEKNLNIRVDNAYRLYTVLNVPEELIGEAYSLKKADIDRISETYIREYSGEVARFLNSKGLVELFRSYEIKKVDKYSYLIVIGFSLFQSNEFYNNLYYKFIPLLTILGIISYFLLKN